MRRRLTNALWMRQYAIFCIDMHWLIVVLKELGFIRAARQESNDSRENVIHPMHNEPRFSDVSSGQLLTTNQSVVEGGMFLIYWYNFLLFYT